MFFLRFLIVALTYFVFARLGTALAIPPDYAAAVWPAAGVALASFLLFSRAVAFTGVMAGAVLANLYTTTSALTELSLTALVSGIAMGAGATLQGFFGAWLYHAYLPGRGRWDELPHLLRFCFIVVALGSVVSTTI
ncbi:MASE1 domain-containing protein, partial [Thalassolituus sp.]|uniref:MASE1 domain-containing protein n=1 Tax=Thalassolituus sp. TaxID=2030822 RepID=UPI0027D5A652